MEKEKKTVIYLIYHEFMNPLSTYKVEILSAQ